MSSTFGTDDSADSAERRASKTQHLGAPGTEPAALDVPQQVGRFRVLRELGRGGMGVVLLAHDPQLDRLAAVKLMRTDDPHALERFRLEAHALAGIAHPNAVRVFETGETGDRHFIVMEHIEGSSLARELLAGPLAPARAAALLGAVAGAVHVAHRAGVLHRDLKPANVLLDPVGVPKLTDFGVAKRLDRAARLTATDAAVGTPAYMAPEQAGEGPVDVRADVYGLGATLYECLTGRPPFTGPAPVVLRQLEWDEPVPPRRLNPAVPADLETVCLKCLEKDPARRYPTAAELADDLGRAARGEPVLARPVGGAARAGRWARRNPAVAALGAATAAALAVGAVGAGWQAHRATVARDAEALSRREADQRAAEAEAARTQAQADKRRAEDSADEAAAVNAFLLEDLLLQASARAQAGTGARPNPALTVRQALDRAAARVGDRFRGRPAAEEGVRAALGRAYLGVGAFEPAVEQLGRTLPARTARLGKGHRDTLALTRDFGWAVLEAGRPVQAVGVLDECVRLAREHLGPRDRDTLAALNLLARAHRSGAPARAAALHEECLRDRREALGPDDPDTLASMSSLAELYREAGRAVDALALADEAVRRYRARVGPDHPETLVAATGLVMAYREAGRVPDAVALAEDTVGRCRAALGPDHPHTLAAQNLLALVYQAAGRRGAAVPVLEECLRGHRRTLGPNHPYALTVLYNLGAAHLSLGRPGDALPLLEECLRRRRDKLTPEHPDTRLAGDALAFAYRSVGRPSDAVPLLEESLKGLRAWPGPAHPRTRATVGNLAVLYRELGRPGDAVPLCRELYDARPGTGPDHPLALGAAGDLGWALLEAGRAADALPLFEAVWAARTGREPADPREPEARLGLGTCLLRLDRFTEAEPHLSASHASLAAPGNPEKLRARGRMALWELYTALGRPEVAAQWPPAPLPVAPVPRRAERR